MIDWHCHILPGIDDGPDTMDESVQLARALVEAGFRTVYCTPHLIRGRFEVDNVTVRAAVTNLQAELARQNLPLRLIPGREYYLDEFLGDHLKDPLLLGETRFLLIELSNNLPPEFVKETCYRIKCNGYVPVIAHPERCTLFLQPKAQDKWAKAARSLGKMVGLWQSTPEYEPEDNSLLTYLQDIGCGFQGNLGSLIGRYGETARTIAESFRDQDIYSFYGSDAHSPRGVTGLVSLMNANEQNARILAEMARG